VSQHHICLPFESEAHYTACLADLAQYRQFLAAQWAAHPELFPQAFAAGYEFHSQYQLRKQHLTLRRIKLTATGAVFTLRPSLVLPYGVARTAEVEKALYLCQFGVPFAALAYVFGHSPSFWQRAWLSFGRPSLLGTTVKDPSRLPAHLVADEKVTWQDGAEVLLATTVGGGCFLGVGVARDASAATLQRAYGEFQAEAQELAPAYAPATVCTDGFKATRLAWQQLFPQVTLLLCFLHGVLKIMERCRGTLRHAVLDRVWECYHATTRRQFSQRLRRLKEWADTSLSGAVAEMTRKLERQRARYVAAYSHPQAHRTTNAVDRLMNYQDRWLYARRYLQGDDPTARLAVRAQALVWNFHPYSVRLRRAAPQRHSPFADMNGFQYHDNWLHNLLVAASLGGHKC
jgi:hypothetical protein